MLGTRGYASVYHERCQVEGTQAGKTKCPTSASSLPIAIKNSFLHFNRGKRHIKFPSSPFLGVHFISVITYVRCCAAVLKPLSLSPHSWQLCRPLITLLCSTPSQWHIFYAIRWAAITIIISITSEGCPVPIPSHSPFPPVLALMTTNLVRLLVCLLPISHKWSRARCGFSCLASCLGPLEISLVKLLPK